MKQISTQDRLLAQVIEDFEIPAVVKQEDNYQIYDINYYQLKLNVLELITDSTEVLGERI